MTLKKDKPALEENLKIIKTDTRTLKVKIRMGFI
jgi:hypothetical protein